MNPTPNKINPPSGFVPNTGIPLYPGARPFMMGVQPPHFINYPSVYNYNSFLQAGYPYTGTPGYMPAPVNPPIQPYPMFSHPISTNQVSMVNPPKDPKQQQQSQNTAQNQNAITSTTNTNSSNNSSKEFDRQAFKEELLYKNGREKDWHLRLLANDRKQVETMLEEAVELQIHFQNFQKEFNKMSQTSSTMNAEALQNFNLWNSWKENLLARRNQTFLLQEERLNKFYQKVRNNVPDIVQQSITSTSMEAVKPSNTESIDLSRVQQESQSQPLPTSSMPETDQNSLNSSDNRIVSFDDRKSLTSSISSENDYELAKIDKFSEKYKPSVQSALNYQEKMNRNSLFMLENKRFTKSLNDFAFVRNEMMFIDNLISLARSKSFEYKAQHHDIKSEPVPIKQSPIKESPSAINPIQKSNTLSSNVSTSKSNPISVHTSSKPIPVSSSSTSLSRPTRHNDSSDLSQKKINPQYSLKPEPFDQIQTIKIQITHPGQRKVTNDIKINKIDNKTNDDTVSLATNIPTIEATTKLTATVSSNSKDQPRTNNIQVPIVSNDNDRNRNKTPIIGNRPSNLLPKPPALLLSAPISSTLPKPPSTSILPKPASILPKPSSMLPAPSTPIIPKPVVSMSAPSTSYYMPGTQPIFDPKSSLPSQTSSPISNTYSKNDKPISSFSVQDMNSFIRNEQKSLQEFESPKLSHSYENPNFFTLPRKYSEEPLSIKDLLDFPGRSYRPSRIVFIIRGLPGSGKTHLARLIKEREESNSQLTKIRFLSMDNYYLNEHDDRDHERFRNDNGSFRVKTYDFDPDKEVQFKYMLFKDFREITTQGSYNFIILDSVNSAINDVRHFYACAIENNYIPYVIEMEAIVRRLLNYCVDSEEIIAYCYKHNQHGRSLAEIRSLYSEWQILPDDYLRVNAFPLVEKHSEIIESSSTRIIAEDNDLIKIRIPNQSTPPNPYSKWMDNSPSQATSSFSSSDYYQQQQQSNEMIQNYHHSNFSSSTSVSAATTTTPTSASSRQPRFCDNDDVDDFESRNNRIPKRSRFDDGNNTMIGTERWNENNNNLSYPHQSTNNYSSTYYHGADRRYH
ncbi:uncharacterized protein LOC113791557 [Dermatophagoides pteronyssinus]|uniref:uncharacterized protein LOC113791557 n=1 Tax=Dermatophagoides pteronyssinus TaxID=6956 RepID=UPI003F6650BB